MLPPDPPADDDRHVGAVPGDRVGAARGDRPLQPAIEELPPWWTYVDWPGAVAFVLALGVALSMVIAIWGASTQDDAISEQGAQLLSTLFGASVGAVATYLGMAQRANQARGRTRATDTDKHNERQ
jgi:hypothetical protein